jgi:hypothetical protein
MKDRLVAFAYNRTEAVHSAHVMDSVHTRPLWPSR